jgi:hypothetical protein
MDFDSIHHIKVGGHYYQFYKTQEDYLQISLSFLYAGLKKGDACLWLVSDAMGTERAEKEFLDVYPDATGYLLSHQLQIKSAHAWYLKRGSFDEEQAIWNAKDFMDSAFKRDFSCVRGLGDMGAIPDDDWMKVWEYETKLHTILQGLPLIAVCAYPILRCSIADTRRVIQLHHEPLAISLAS